jgi:hypothetical protein
MNLTVVAAFNEWMSNASDSALRAIVNGGVPRQYAIIVLAKQELARREPTRRVNPMGIEVSPTLAAAVDRIEEELARRES